MTEVCELEGNLRAGFALNDEFLPFRVERFLNASTGIGSLSVSSPDWSVSMGGGGDSGAR